MNRNNHCAGRWTKICLLLVALSFSFDAVAQRTRISILPQYNMPLGKLTWSHKPSPGIQIEYSNVRKKRNFRTGFSLGYTALLPIADTLYYVVDKGGIGGVGIGTAVFSPFQMIQLKATLDFQIPMAEKKLFFNLGFGLGATYASRKMEMEDNLGGSDSYHEIVGWGTIVPRAAIEYRVTDNFSLAPFAAYTLMIQAGSTDARAMDYNPATGTVCNFYSLGVSLNYNF